MDLADKMMLWEDEELNVDEERALFQELIDSGLVWQLQGCYGRHAKMLIRLGFCIQKKGQEKK